MLPEWKSHQTGKARVKAYQQLTSREAPPPVTLKEVSEHPEKCIFPGMDEAAKEQLKRLADVDSSDVLITIPDIENRVLSLQLSMDNLQLMMPKGEQDPSHLFQKRIDFLKEIQAPLMEKLKKMPKIIVSRLEVPEKYGTIDTISIEHLRLSVNIFNPRDSDENDLLSLWRKLKIYGEINEYSETAFKNALSNVLQGECFELFYMNRSKPLSKILEIIEQAYLSLTTLQTLDEQLKGLKREGGESIVHFIQKCKNLLHKTSELRANPTEYSEIILFQKLKENVTKECQAFLAREINKFYKMGKILDFSSLLQLAREKEAGGEPDLVPAVQRLNQSSFAPGPEDSGSQSDEDYTEHYGAEYYSEEDADNPISVSQSWHQCHSSESSDEGDQAQLDYSSPSSEDDSIDHMNSGLHSTTTVTLIEKTSN